MRITGAKAHVARLKRIRGPEMVREVGKAVLTAAGEIGDLAALSITTGNTGARGQHVVSKPGEPPNADLGNLDRSIHAEKAGDLTANVVADARHAVPLEFGTSKMAARPFMAPAAQKGRPRALELVKEATKRVTGGGKR